jgi:hypothetical protein
MHVKKFVPLIDRSGQLDQVIIDDGLLSMGVTSFIPHHLFKSFGHRITLNLADGCRGVAGSLRIIFDCLRDRDGQHSVIRHDNLLSSSDAIRIGRFRSSDHMFWLEN